MKREMYPFGMRVFIKVDTQTLDNIGTDLLTGVITKVSDSLELVQNDEHYVKDMNTLLYYLSDDLKVGTQVIFKNDPKIIDNTKGIYNVPVELIRQVSRDNE